MNDITMLKIHLERIPVYSLQKKRAEKIIENKKYSTRCGEGILRSRPTRDRANVETM